MVFCLQVKGVLEVQEPGGTDFLADTYDDNVRQTHGSLLRGTWRVGESGGLSQ